MPKLAWHGLGDTIIDRPCRHREGTTLCSADHTPAPLNDERHIRYAGSIKRDLVPLKAIVQILFIIFTGKCVACSRIAVVVE
jgi:hypothetical protein